MSRAFVKEDARSWGDPSKRYSLPAREHPGFDKAAAEALLEGARAIGGGLLAARPRPLLNH